MNEQEVTLRISGNTCKGEYCLNIGAASTAVVFNLGKPDGMMDSSLLKAAAGHTYVRLDPNARVVTVDQLDRWAENLEEVWCAGGSYACVQIRAIIGEVKP